MIVKAILGVFLSFPAADHLFSLISTNNLEEMRLFCRKNYFTSRLHQVSTASRIIMIVTKINYFLSVKAILGVFFMCPSDHLFSSTNFE